MSSSGPRKPDLNTIYTINDDGSRNFLHLADVRGIWHKRRTAVYYVLLAVFLGAPLLSIDGRPLIHFDIPGRAAHLFGASFTNQDFYLFFFVLIGAGLGIFIMTSLFGRVWCGFLCPQTLFMEGIYRPVERFIEGDHVARKRRERKGAGASRISRLLLKHAIFLFLSWTFSLVFMAYFIPVRELFSLIPLFPGHHTALLWSLFWTGMLYFDYSWFREQTCLIICPYGRLQSTLVDYDSIIIGYDRKRGEPRSHGIDNGGDCIDCRRCVDVCPTGIDIRNGLQMECIGCTNCIDACDEIMDKIGKPHGLVRFDSSRSLETGERRFMRPRFWIYAIAVLVMGGFFVQRAVTRESFQVTITRAQGMPYTIENGVIRNLYTVHLQNKSDEAKVFQLEPAPDALAGIEGVEYIIPQTRIPLEAMADQQLIFFAQMPKANYDRPRGFNFAVRDSASGATQTFEIRFRGP